MDTDQAQLLKEISSFLSNHQISYMITGAWSSIFYGRPRASHDIDFVVELHAEDLPKISAAFRKLSGEFTVQTKSIEEAVEQKSMFNLIHLPTMLKLDFWILTEEQFDQARFNRRKKVTILGQQMDIASAEDTILQKLKWYQQSKVEKHFIDAAFVYQVQEKNLDKKYLKKWMRILGIENYFQQLKNINLEQHV